MTIQASDHLTRGGDRSVLLDSSGPLFDPAAHGFRPVMRSTGCVRGYVCEFELRDGALRLHALDINHQPGRAPVTLRKQLPALNGVAATEQPDSRIGAWRFGDVALPLTFDGSLIVGRDQAAVSRLCGGWRGAWQYRHVEELVFEAGRLVASIVLDDQVAPIRGRALAAKNGLDLFHAIDQQALAACFSFDDRRRC